MNDRDAVRGRARSVAGLLSLKVRVYPGHGHDAGVLDPAALDPAAGVPEPSTWAMMLLGFAGLGFAFRQSRRKVLFA